ncbi:hypothetical protein SAMN04488543_2254 [Friedmanniella luteola]|uniref:CDP-Glycerol:Poly(Glycerophosphate) glycerophosphotransferase n=1 Tax=Friedmanniella luteola TaxID=546871 RepID=A0A1H1UHD4_9ACTN|nr:DUF6716 putative glycosyltransferase [Friedmanniella luteola]SDS71925.1 hypothetical protein SAMN04488543_2254 [Friedmanniella luteola]
MRRALFVAAFDSQLKWCARIRDELERRGFTSEVVVPDVRSALSPGQIADAGFTAVEHVTWSELLDRAVAADVVVCSLSGPFTKGFVFDLAARTAAVAGPGPVVVTGWVGIIIDRITGGYLDRCGSDVVAVNSGRDLEHFERTARALQMPADNLLLAGLPFLSSEPAPPRRTPVRRLLLADQPTVPSTEADRRFLYAGAVAYARAHPDREVVLKPRHRPEEDTLHRMQHHPAVLLAEEDLPPNFRIDHTPIAELLPDVDLLVTMSSTACLEALDHGCRVALVLDLGVHERFGNHVFLDSGLLRTWAEITDDRLGEADPAWLAGYFFPRAQGATAVVADRVEALLDSGERPARAVRASDYFRSAAVYHRAQEAVAAVPTPPRTLRPRDLLPPVLYRPVARGLRRCRPVAARAVAELQHRRRGAVRS